MEFKRKRILSGHEIKYEKRNHHKTMQYTFEDDDTATVNLPNMVSKCHVVSHVINLVVSHVVIHVASHVVSHEDTSTANLPNMVTA